MPRLLEELQFPSLSDVVKPKAGVSLYNSNGVLKILHSDGREEIIATGELGDIGLDDYYTKDEVDELISTLGPSGFEVIILESSTLPSTGESGKLYLLPNGDIYSEYLYVNNKWEQIGSTSIDLSGYALKSEIPTLTSQLINDSGFIDKNSLPDLSEYVEREDLKGYYTKNEVESLLQNAGGKATFRTWTEV